MQKLETLKIKEVQKQVWEWISSEDETGSHTVPKKQGTHILLVSRLQTYTSRPGKVATQMCSALTFFFFFEALNCSQIWLLFCVGVNKHMTETFSAKLKPSSDMPKCHGFLAKYLRFFVWFGLDIVKKFSLDF